MTQGKAGYLSCLVIDKMTRGNQLPVLHLISWEQHVRMYDTK